MFEVTQRGETITVKTEFDTWKVKYNQTRRLFQIFKAPSKAIYAESYHGFQGALDMIARKGEH